MEHEQKPAATVLRERVTRADGIDEFERDRGGPDPALASRVTHAALSCRPPVEERKPGLASAG